MLWRMVDAAPVIHAPLRALLVRVFEDGVLEPHEREQLQALWREAGLTVSVVKATVLDFLREVLSDALTQGTLTPAAKSKLQTIVRELRIPPPMLPDEVKRLIA
jgi:hypothetical protein